MTDKEILDEATRIALRIVPVGSKPSVVIIRQGIIRAFQEIIPKLMEKIREEHTPPDFKIRLEVLEEIKKKETERFGKELALIAEERRRYQGAIQAAKNYLTWHENPESNPENLKPIFDKLITTTKALVELEEKK